MKEQAIIMNRLLDKYERSKHLSEPGKSLRRVMLKMGKQGNKEFPEYRYEEVCVRDAFNSAAVELEQMRLVKLNWIVEGTLLSEVILNLDQLEQCYHAAHRVHPMVRAGAVEGMVSAALDGIAVPWIAAWRDEVCRAARDTMKVPLFCKADDGLLRDLLRAFACYAELEGSVTMRAFSSRCFSNSKYFERKVRDPFLRIAGKYETGLADLCREENLSERDQLAYLGIYARPELYELAGDCTIETGQGSIWIGAAAECGLALPSTLVDSIAYVDLRSIECITLIENKTNYDEYLTSEQKPWELIIYHGGFMSPQKIKLIARIVESASPSTVIRFWADIDMGGFRMFERLNRIIPNLQPMRMSACYVEQYHENGLARSDAYLNRLQSAMEHGEYERFRDAICAILKYHVTIEQEIFLNGPEADVGSVI